MNDCCHLSYQNEFDNSNAKKELENYRRNDLKKSSRALLEVVKKLPLQGKALLDIGGGIGVIPLELFREGIHQTTHIEISEASRQAFLLEAKRQAIIDKVESKCGDFLDIHHHVNTADLVTLDKVICCYENYQDLVKESVAKARLWYVYSIPRDVWWVRLVHRAEQWVRKWQGKYFRSYIHPSAKIEKLVQAAGFQKVQQRHQREWLIVVFEKKSAVRQNA